VKEIKLTQDKVAQVDDADYEWLSAWKWYAKWDGWHWYAMRNSPYDANGKQHTILMHRQILGAQPGEQVDHRNRKGLDKAYIGTSEQANGKHESECMANGSILVFLTMRSPPPLPIIRLPPNTLVNLQDRIHYESFPANARLRCSRTCIENPNRPQKTAQSFLHCDTQNEYSLAFTRKLDMMLELCYYGCEIRRQA